MFRSKRSTLVKRLWKNRIIHNETAGKNESDEELELKSIIHSMLKRLKEKNLEILVQSVETKGGEDTPCVLLPSGEMKLGKRSVPPHYVCCQIWRWQDLTPTSPLRQLPSCQTVNDSAYTCCNPYHWSIEQNIDLPPVPNFEQLDLDDHAKISEDVWSQNHVMECVSTETGFTPSPRQDLSDLSEETSDVQNGHHHWCTVAYWELRQRMGRLYTVHNPHVNIFQSLPHGDGLSLELLQEKSELDSVRRTREKIGFGVILSRERGGVWLYNRSLYPVFVNSPMLDIPNSRTSVVIKVSPGYSMKIFDYEYAFVMKQVYERQFLDGPYDPTSIRVSFAKGWGPSYHRQFVTSCPCWIEILLNVHR
ncbi:hypothetical protein FSP39_002311 [Pinctada imbricata]|uniref:Mothers against decapentaplegic homolog n=2 Tax=Pinctada TaxID=50425 RepID=A0AA88Y533_PINIB|nr:TGF beta signaling pathway factor SMAD6 [Pinctada fucata]KAK3094481.1 hypothetical protein FSP39_002311 [Pinctada imbricata]